MRCAPAHRPFPVCLLLVLLLGCSGAAPEQAAPGEAIQFRLIDQAPDSQAEELTVKDTTVRLRVAPKVLMTGAAIATVESLPEPPPGGGRYSIKLGLTRDGAARFADLTARHAKQLLAVVADGQIVAAAQIPDSPILDGTFLINGRYTEQEAAGIVRQLRGHLE